MAEKFQKTAQKLKLAAVQAAPAFLNKVATTRKVCSLIREAGKQGADVIGFPEGFIPGHPGWIEVIPLTPEPAPSLFAKLFDQAVEVPGPEVSEIQQACKEANVAAVVGIQERRPGTTGTLYNTQLIFGCDGTLLHKHQKFVPTIGERVIHTPGDTGSKASALTEFGCLSGLICGENGNPLAQYSLSLDYPVVHVASWPQHFGPGMEMQDAILLHTRALAASVGCYVINAVSTIGQDMIETYGQDAEIRDFMEQESAKRRATILAPWGEIITGPGPDGETNEGIVYAEADIDNIIKFKYTCDYAGHYNRPELFAHHFKRFFEKDAV